MPQVKKSIGTVRFIPLARMTPEMWRVLDYENLRETAKNRLAEKARDGIIGFFDINIVEKAGPAKPRYFLPVVTSKEVEAWESEGGAPGGFENSEDVEDLTTEAQELDSWVDSISLGITLVGVKPIINHLMDNRPRPSNPSVSDGETGAGTPLDIDGEPGMMSTQDKADAEELIELAESGALDNLDDIDAALMIALYLFDKYEYEWLEALIEAAQDEF